MCCKVNYSEVACNTAMFSLNSAVVAGISNLAGHAIGCLNGAGFGLIQGVVSTILKEYMLPCCPLFHEAIALTTGGLVAYGASHAVAALGFIAAPISAPSAIVLTISNFALYYLVTKGKPYADKAYNYMTS